MEEKMKFTDESNTAETVQPFTDVAANVMFVPDAVGVVWTGLEQLAFV